MTRSRSHGEEDGAGMQPGRRAPEHVLWAAALSRLREPAGGEGLTFPDPRNPRGVEYLLVLGGAQGPHSHQQRLQETLARELPPGAHTAPRPLSPGRPSHRQDLLAVQAVAVEEQGVHSVSGASSLDGRGRDIQEVLGAQEETAKRLGSGLALIPNRGRANGGFKTVIWVTDPKPHIL